VTHPFPIERALDVVSDVFVVFDNEFRLTYHNEANRAAMRAAGMDPDAALGKHVLDAMPQLRGTAGLRESHRALTDRVRTQWEESYGPEVRLRGRAYPTDDGGILVVATNITAEWRAREQADRSSRWADHLHMLTAKLAAAVSPDDVAHVVIEQAKNALHVDRGSVSILEPDGDTIRLFAVTGYDDAEIAAWRSYSKRSASISRETLDTLTPAFLENAAACRGRWGDALIDNLEQLGIGAIAVVPVAITRVTRLMFSFAWNEPREISAEERVFIQTFAAQSAQAFERAMAFEAEHVARASAESANRAKSDFLAAMSHELRTPLNAIGGYTELLTMGLRGPLSEQQHADLRRIGRNQSHLLTIIDEILNFARLEAGHVELALGPVVVSDVISDIEPLLAPQLEEKQLRFLLDGCDPAIVIHADREKVQQVLLNLAGNALKFTQPGGEIGVGVDADAASVRIFVRDNGVGIPEDKLEAIFEPFVQAHRTLTHPTPGTGLGLAISRDLARRMGGDISVDSAVGLGSTFTLALPRSIAIA
jgi:signal transduction histidine kinase